VTKFRKRLEWQQNVGKHQVNNKQQKERKTEGQQKIKVNKEYSKNSNKGGAANSEKGYRRKGNYIGEL
jgi:hypothetical protein